MLSRIIDIDDAASIGSRHSLGCSMQQEWLSPAIMTSRRQAPTGGGVRKFLARALAPWCVGVMMASCAALPEDAPVMEQLDEDTGLTIARLGHPMELYRETFQRDPSGRFAFLAPFETNQMGSRELYLWTALPVDIAAGTEPDLELDGHKLALGTPSRDASAAGLRHSPYKIPTPWSAMFYYKIDADVVAKLAARYHALHPRDRSRSRTAPRSPCSPRRSPTRASKDFAAR